MAIHPEHVVVWCEIPVTDLEATKARIFDAGGRVEGPDIEMPFGTFFYARDLDGNSIGLFRPRG